MRYIVFSILPYFFDCCFWINETYKYYTRDGRILRVDIKTKNVKILSRDKKIWQQANKYTSNLFN